MKEAPGAPSVHGPPAPQRAYSEPVTKEAPDPLFDEPSPGQPGDWALSLSVPADTGHRDELRGPPAPGAENADALAPTWSSFFEHVGTDGLADLNRRNDNLQRQIRDNGVTYNVYADAATGLVRPWALDLFPMLVAPEDWALIEAGVKRQQRAIADELHELQQSLCRVDASANRNINRLIGHVHHTVFHLKFDRQPRILGP